MNFKCDICGKSYETTFCRCYDCERRTQHTLSDSTHIDLEEAHKGYVKLEDIEEIFQTQMIKISETDMYAAGCVNRFYEEIKALGDK